MIQTSATHPIYLTDMIQLPSLLPLSDTSTLLLNKISLCHIANFLMGVK